MDADTRHQLKQNELAEALRNLLDFRDKRTIAWLVVILAIALGYGGYKFWGWWQQVHLIQSYQTLTTVNATDASLGDAPLAKLRQLIADNTQPGLVAISRLQLAQGLEARGQGADGAAKLTTAETQYQAILQMPDAPNHIQAAATYRLGILYETMQEFGKAREAYTALSESQRFKGSPFTDLAVARLDPLDDRAVPVKFEPGVKPLATTQPTTQPTMMPIFPPPELSDRIRVLPKPASPPAATPPPPATTTQPATDDGATGAAPPTEPSEPQQP